MLAAIWLLTVGAIETRAQDINDAVTFEDLGFTSRLNAGARAAGLAGTYTAIGNDTHALIYNPAGLARLRRIELGIGFQHQRNDLENVFFDVPGNLEFTSSTLDYIAGAYPLPTYRGSLVLAFGAYRVMTSDIDILHRGFNNNTATDDDYRLQQSGGVFSYNFGAGLDLAPNLSVGLNLFFLDGTISALTQFRYDAQPPFNPGDQQGSSLVDDAKVDLDGFGAAIGFQYNPVPVLQFGLLLNTPVQMNIQGGAVAEEVEHYFNSADSLFRDSFLIDTDYDIPLQVTAGVGLSFANTSIAADVSYTDWGQATIDNVELKDENLLPIFRDVVDLRAGIEFTIPHSPVRLRGGYAYLPHPLKFLQADRISADQITEATIVTERQMISGGLGFLAGKVLTIDVAYEYHFGERSIATLTDKRTSQRFLLSGSYRY